MKKIFLVILIFITQLHVYAQKYDVPGNYGTQLERARFMKAMHLPMINVKDKVQTNILKPGAFAYDSVNKSFIGSTNGTDYNLPVLDTRDLTRTRMDTLTRFNINFNGNVMPPGFTNTMSTYGTLANNRFVLFGVGGDLTHYLQYDSAGAQENCFQELTIRCDNGSGQSFGMQLSYIGISTCGYAKSISFGYGSNNAAPTFKRAYITQTQSTFYNSADSTTNVSTGDTLKITGQILKRKFIGTVRNITKGWTLSVNVDQDLITGPFPATTYKCRASFLGGAWSIVGWKYSIIRPHDLQYVDVGNSITKGQAATIYPLAYPNQYGDTDRKMVMAGGGDASPELRAFIPEYLFVTKGTNAVGVILTGNEITCGVSDWQGDLRYVQNKLDTAGARHIWLLPPPRASQDPLAVVNLISTDSVFRYAKYIDLYYVLKGPRKTGSGIGLDSNYSDPDNLHPNNAGMARIAGIISSAVDKVQPIYANQAGNFAFAPVGMQPPAISNTWGNTNNAISIVPESDGKIKNFNLYGSRTVALDRLEVTKTPNGPLYISVLDDNIVKYTFGSGANPFEVTPAGIRYKNVPADNAIGGNANKYLRAGFDNYVFYTNVIPWVDVTGRPLTGASTQSGDGSTTTFNIAHGWGSTPGYWNATAASLDAKGIDYITVTSTNVVVHYTTPPVTGTNNLTWTWIVK